MSGRRISLRREIPAVTEIVRPAFLDWINELRKANDDSIAWWMTHLAGRNNLVSSLFLNLCQIAAAMQWLDAHPEGEAVLIVCEDGFLLQATRESLDQITKVSVRVGWYRHHLFHTGGLIARAFKVAVAEVVRHARRQIAAKRTRTQRNQPQRGEAVVIHQCLDDHSFASEGAQVCRYFTELPARLEGEGRSVFRLPWLAKVNLPLCSVYRTLRSSRSIIPEDWLGPSDYFTMFANELRAVRAIRTDIQLPGMAVRALALRERFEQLGAGTGEFWLTIPVLARWGGGLTRCDVITHFEGMVPEHPIVFFARNVIQDGFAVGYQHSLISRDFLAYHFIEEEWASPIMPNRVVTSGKIGREMLVRQGAPAARIVEGPALRQISAKHEDTNLADGGLLVLLPLMADACVELLETLLSHKEVIAEIVGRPIQIRCHPMSDPKRVMSALRWESLPDGWVWTNVALESALSSNVCCLTMATASAIDAVLAGKIVVSLGTELGSAWNVLDVFEAEFPLVATASRDDLPTRLKDVYQTRREEYELTFGELRRRLSVGLGKHESLPVHPFVRYPPALNYVQPLA